MTSRDDQGFTATVTPLLKDLYGAALRLTRNSAEAEDLVQDSMLRAFRSWETFKQGTNIRAWMFTILRNTFINGFHKRSRMRAFELDINDQMRSLGASIALGHADGTTPSPEETVSASITAVRIREALDQIPVDFRQAVMLADLEGLSYAEIAEIMGSPVGTVMSRVYRGRRLLHTILFRPEAIEGLPGDLRQAVALADVNGATYQEIAATMGTSIGTAVGRVAEGRLRLRVAS